MPPSWHTSSDSCGAAWEVTSSMCSTLDGVHIALCSSSAFPHESVQILYMTSIVDLQSVGARPMD